MKQNRGEQDRILDRQRSQIHLREDEIDRIFHAVWETAVHKNPMCLVKMIAPDSVFSQMRALIRDCLVRGISEAQMTEVVLKELLQSAASGKLPRGRWDDETAH
jgi:hypothetical protein